MIENRILKTELIEWKTLEWLQNPNLKEMSKNSFLRLKNSLKKNSFIQPFNVWEDNGKIWILDGHHRKKAMEALETDGEEIPDELPANFIDCANRKEAVKLILVYSSIYANVTDEGLYELISLEKLELEDLKDMIDLPRIDFKKFEEGYFEKNEQEKSVESDEYTLMFTFLKDDAAYVQERLHRDRENHNEELDDKWRERCLLRILRQID